MTWEVVNMSQIFYKLSDKVQKKIWDMGWKHFTPIQEKAIPVIIDTEKDVVLSSGTASGKTEAAFLPIISKIHETASNVLKVLYVSPLKALINNQFERLQKLCEEMNIPVHRWHGDVSQHSKKKLINNPAGILQITPESIESLFINRTQFLKQLFQELEFIVIDELHAFIDTERGVQLRSLLSRIKQYTKRCPRIIGLSATIDNFSLIKKWINCNNPDNVEIIEVKGFERDIYYSLMHFEKSKTGNYPLELYEDILELTRNYTSLIFFNSRSAVEEATVILNRLAQREKLGERYFAHHSSIAKAEREFVEKLMSESTGIKSVIATSSLELGIDIGEIDLVIQVDSTFTVSSLKQRLGRSGRKQGEGQYLQMYTTDKYGLLQSIAVMDLLLQGWTEPCKGYPYPYDILFHQIISICHQLNGIPLEKLVSLVSENAAFYELPESDIRMLVEHMIGKEYLEILAGTQELIVGLEGERLLRQKDFYSVFMTPEVYEVFYGTKNIGEIEKTFLLNEGDNIILAGRLWKIEEIDFHRNKVYVKKAMDGKPPRYSGGLAPLHPRIPERMHEILCLDCKFDFIDDRAQTALEELKVPYKYFNVKPDERIIWQTKEKLLFETFTGTNIFRTLIWMLRYYGVDEVKTDGIGRMEIPLNDEFIDILQDIKSRKWSLRSLLPYTKEEEFFVSKYSDFLPSELQIKMHGAHNVDIEGVLKFLDKFRIRIISLE